LFIDLSQVIMFTFVNAILDIGAGNFAQLLGITGTGNLDFGDGNVAAAFTGGTALASIVIQLGLMIAILAVMVCLAIAFLWRIVILWVLVILSPIAFFFRFAPDVIDFGFGKGGDWWSKFTGALVMGPMLSFFLWLSLALSSSGNLLSAEGFPEPPASGGAFGNILDQLTSSSLGATMLALIFLVVGMDMAGKSAKSLGGIAGKLINEGMGRKIVGQSVRAAGYIQGAAAVAAPYVAYKGAVTTRGMVGGAMGNSTYANARDPLLADTPRTWGEIGQDIVNGGRRANVKSANLIDGGRQYARNGLAGAGGLLAGAGTFLGADGLVRLGDKARQRAGADSEARQKEGKKAYGELTGAGKNELLANIALDPELPQNEAEKNIRLAAQADLLKSKVLQGKRLDALKAQLAPQFGDDDAGKKAAEVEAKKRLDAELTSAMKRMGELEVDNDLDPFMTNDDLRNARNKFVDLYAGLDKKKAQALVDSDKFNLRDMRDEALSNGDVVSALDKSTHRVTDTGIRISRLDELKRGGGGQSKKEILNNLGQPQIRATNETDANVQGRATNTLDSAILSPTDPTGPRRAATAEEIALNIESKNIVESNISVKDLEGGNSQALNEALVDRRVRVQSVGSGLPASERDQAQTAYFGRMEALAKGMDQWGRAFVDDRGASRQLTDKEKDRMYRAQQLTDEETLRRAATAASDDAARKTATLKALQSQAGAAGGPGGSPALDLERIRRLLASDIKNARHLSASTITTGFNPQAAIDAQREIVRAISPASLDEAVKKLQQAVKSKDTQEIIANRDFLTNAIEAIRSEASRIQPRATGQSDSAYADVLARKNPRLAEAFKRSTIVELVQNRSSAEYDSGKPPAGPAFKDL
jgi:hypothetical protein